MRATPRRSFRAAVTIVALTTAALLGTAGAALACTGSDNDRGKPEQHPVPANCSDAGKSGDTLVKDVDYTVTTTHGGRWLDITAKDGVKVTSIVVAGGDDGFYAYTPGKHGLSANSPWKDLRAPFGRDNDEDSKIDKILVCGSKEAKPTDTAKPTETSTSAPTSSAKETSTSSAVAPAGNNTGGTGGGGLANTGFNNMWLVWVAALLLLSGGGILGFLKFRRKASN